MSCGSRYTIEDAKKWVEKYKECGSIKETSIYFGVDKGTISKWFKNNKDKFDILLPRDPEIRKDGKKLCKDCKVYKDENLDNFYMNGDYLNGTCKECDKLKQKQYTEDNYDKVMERITKYQEEHPDKIRDVKRRWKKNHPEYELSEESKLKEKERIKKWNEENRQILNKKRVERRNNSVQYKLTCILRTRLSNAIKGNYKSGSAIRDLGCSVEELIQYLEKQFFPNPRTGEEMSWKNHSRNGWHIDHIIPLASFNLIDREQLLKACHYTNLQPLWAKENIAKRDKIIGDKK